MCATAGIVRRSRCDEQRESLHSMDESVFCRLAKVKIVELSDNVFMQGASFQEIDKLFVERCLWLIVEESVPLLRKINQKDTLDKC